MLCLRNARAFPLLPAALASVPFGFVLVRVRVRVRVIGIRETWPAQWRMENPIAIVAFVAIYQYP